MQKVNDIEKVLEALPGANQTRFPMRNYEEGIKDALSWVLGKEGSREMEVYERLAGLPPG